MNQERTNLVERLSWYYTEMMEMSAQISGSRRVQEWTAGLQSDTKQMKTAADICGPGEWNRLTKSPYHRLEFLVFMHHIERYLPSQGLVLDAGGGPGRYTVELCNRGLEVVLLDLSPSCTAFAKTKVAELDSGPRACLKEAVVGNVTDLSRFPAETFDMVLCLDPLSCLADLPDRKKALLELVRVAKTGSPVAIAVRGYLAVLATIVRIAGHELMDGTLDGLRQTGNCNVRGLPHHFFRAAEIRELAESCGLGTLAQAGGEGLSSAMPEATNAIADDAAKWQRWVEVVIDTSTDPAVVDTSGHMLYMPCHPGHTHWRYSCPRQSHGSCLLDDRY